MTWSERVDTANKYWRILGTVVTVFILVSGGIYAAGRDTEKFTAAQESMKKDIVSVKHTIQKIEQVSLPQITSAVSNNSASNKDINNQVQSVITKVKEEDQELKALKDQVQDIKQQLAAMKTQQKSDADWIKEALKRIESKQ